MDADRPLYTLSDKTKQLLIVIKQMRDAEGVVVVVDRMVLVLVALTTHSKQLSVPLQAATLPVTCLVRYAPKDILLSAT